VELLPGDLAVNKEYKKAGIGKKLIDLKRKSRGRSNDLVAFGSTAMEYYPKVGFSRRQGLRHLS
jgi:predicted N-acetyltransferase YhbS